MTGETSEDPTAPPGDAKALRQLHRFGSRALVDQMVALFVEHVPARIAAARDALAAGDVATVQRMAHMMKSSSAQLGAASLQRLGAEAKALCQRRKTAHVDPLLDAMTVEFDRWKRWVATVDLEEPAGG